MGIRIFHTADLHLGMKFTRGYRPEVQAALVDARFETLAGMVQTANREECRLFAVAGDMFDNRQVTKRDVVRAAEALRAFEGRLVLVLPGNHDYIQAGDDTLWNWFREAAGERTLLLSEARPYDLRPYDVEAVVHAAPCTAKHSSTNAIGWIEPPSGVGAELHHLGMAHGSVTGLSIDFNDAYYPMTPRELEACGMDLWLLGHTHVRFPEAESGSGARYFFPSTPEPDGFDCAHPGHAWIIELAPDRTVSHRSIQTGRFSFHSLERVLAGEEDLAALVSLIEDLPRESALVKLKLSGRVPGSIHDRRGELVTRLEEQVLHLECDLGDLLREVTAEDIDREFTEGSFPHRLLHRLSAPDGDSLALQMAYDLIRGAGS